MDRNLKKIKTFNVFDKHVLSEEFVSVHTVSKKLLIDNNRGACLTGHFNNDIMITNNQLKDNIYNETKSKHY